MRALGVENIFEKTQNCKFHRKTFSKEGRGGERRTSEERREKEKGSRRMKSVS